MYKIFSLIFSMVLVSTTVFAETCPSVNDIKQKHLNGWVAYDSEDGTPISAERINILTKYIHQFALAEHAQNDPKGPAMHCYYRDEHGSDLEAYFSKSNLSPDNSKNWYQVTGYKHCAAGTDKCTFISKLPTTSTNKLAKK